MPRLPSIVSSEGLGYVPKCPEGRGYSSSATFPGSKGRSPYQRFDDRPVPLVQRRPADPLGEAVTRNRAVSSSNRGAAIVGSARGGKGLVTSDVTEAISLTPSATRTRLAQFLGSGLLRAVGMGAAGPEVALSPVGLKGRTRALLENEGRGEH
jgi:hypothetical protein